MWWSSWLSKLGPWAWRRTARESSRRRAVGERLETRALLSAITVNSLADNLTAGDGLVTLREAIAAANADTTTDLGETASGP